LQIHVLYFHVLQFHVRHFQSTQFVLLADRRPLRGELSATVLQRWK